MRKSSHRAITILKLKTEKDKEVLPNIAVAAMGLRSFFKKS
jgi:hypothetical protein